MKLLLLFPGGFNNPKLWSGTPYTLKKLFERINSCQLSTLDWQLNRNLIRIYNMFYAKLFFTWGTSHDPLIHWFAKQKINKKLKNIEDKIDWLLFVSDHCIPPKMEGKYRYAVYKDAILRTQKKFIQDKRLGKKRFFRFQEKSSRIDTERMDLVFTQNEWTRQEIIRHYSISKDKVLNVGFGVNLRPYYGEKNYDNELLLIVLRKGTEKYKGLLLLLDAFNILLKVKPEVKLAVVGTDIGNNHQNVNCYFKQSREVTVELFKKASLYVMPALYEPNGITYLEALANKTPIVGLNRFAVPEFSGYGKWGFIVQNEDPDELAKVIEKALSDKDKLKDMGIKGQQFVQERFRWELVADKMYNKMKSLDTSEKKANPNLL